MSIANETESPYRVPTEAVQARIRVHSGKEFQVTFFLSSLSETHSGPETMEETLNRPRAFIPLQLRETEESFLVRRENLRTVAVGSETNNLVTREENLTGCVDVVRLEMEGDLEVEGTLATVAPREYPRLSDYFNHADTSFIPIFVGDGVTFVNKTYISTVWL